MSNKNTATVQPQGGKSWIIILLVVVLVLIASAIGVAWFLSSRLEAAQTPAAADGAPAAAPRAPAQYFLLDPPFVVNLADEGGTRYLQVEVQVLTRDPGAEPVLKTHNPLIRNRLLLLFSQKRSAELRTREQKEQLQDEALEEIRQVLIAEAGRANVEAVFFTSFVVQ